MRDRMKDAEIAVEKYGWEWLSHWGNAPVLVPPIDDPRRTWAAEWDDNGLPHWLPRYSEGEE